METITPQQARDAFRLLRLLREFVDNGAHQIFFSCLIDSEQEMALDDAIELVLAGKKLPD
jgi:hypothetical protein